MANITFDHALQVGKQSSVILVKSDVQRTKSEDKAFNMVHSKCRKEPKNDLPVEFIIILRNPLNVKVVAGQKMRKNTISRKMVYSETNQKGIFHFSCVKWKALSW